MVDTNILVSIAIFNSSPLGSLLDFVCSQHTLVLSSFIVNEFNGIVLKKFPAKKANASTFFAKLPFELEDTPSELPKHDFFKIRDLKDEPVLYSAITADVDILITGDKDFSDIDLPRPMILSPSKFMELYG